MRVGDDIYQRRHGLLIAEVLRQFEDERKDLNWWIFVDGLMDYNMNANLLNNSADVHDVNDYVTWLLAMLCQQSIVNYYLKSEWISQTRFTSSVQL